MSLRTSRAAVLVVCAVFVVGAGFPPSAQAQSPVRERGRDLVFSEIGSMTQDLERITGWKSKRPVKAEWISRERVRRFIEERIRREVKPEDIRVEKTLLRMLGFVPESFDLARTTIELLTEQAAAFYDYEKKRLYVLDSEESVTERRTTLVHELAHALADQHHSLKKYLRDKRVSDDEAVAREAVVEGQATWLMWAWESERSTGKAEVSSVILDAARTQGGPDEAAFPVLARVPLYVRESLTFPYTAGLLFHDDLYRRSGRASFSAGFKRAPLSTRNVLHPETYARGVIPAKVELPELGEPSRRSTLAEGTLGELDLRVLLTQYTSAGDARLATEWRGGAFRLEEEKGTKKPVLVIGLTMASPEAALQLLSLYRKVLAGKWEQLTVSESTAGRVSGQGDSGSFETWADGATVYSIEGGLIK